MIRNRVSPAHRRLVFKALALVSLGLFVYLVLRMDVGRIWARIIGLGSKGLMILLALRLAYWVLRAWGWALVLRAAGEALLPGRLLAARLAGHSVAYLTPAAKLGGEAVRVLHVRGVDRKTLLASAVVDKTVEFLATLTCISVAFIWILAQGSVPGIRFVTLPAVSAVFAAALIWFYRKQKRGLFEWLLRGLTKIRLLGAPLEKKRESVRLIDARIAALYREQSRTLRLVFLIYLGLILVWALEIRLTFALMGSPEVSFPRCFALVSLGSVALLAPALPASLGFYEITYVSLFVLLGIDLEAGAALILIRRILGLVWAGIGIVPLWRGAGRLRTGTDAPHGSGEPTG